MYKDKGGKLRVNDTERMDLLKTIYENCEVPRLAGTVREHFESAVELLERYANRPEEEVEEVEHRSCLVDRSAKKIGADLFADPPEAADGEARCVVYRIVTGRGKPFGMVVVDRGLDGTRRAFFDYNCLTTRAISAELKAIGDFMDSLTRK